MATLDFSLLGLNQPSVAERFAMGQQEAQRNALAQQQMLHAQQQNALMQMQMGAAQRAEERANRLPQVLGGLPEAASVPEQVNVLTRAGYIDEARKLAESHAKAEADRRAGEAADLKSQFDKLRLMGQVLSGAKDETSYRMARQQAQAINPQFASALPDVYDPERVQSIISQGVDLEKRIADETARRGQDITAATAAAGQKVTMRGQDITAATARRGQDIQKELAFKPQFNAQSGGFVVPPTAGNPQGGFIPLPQVQATKEQEAAAKALKSAGYDAATGEDRIEQLIKKSTSGRAGAGIDAVVGFFGGTTEGREAIGALAARANQIALDLAGGKLGAGISNADRDFIASSLGDVANPNKPVGERLAAWKEAKSRMLTSGMIPPPKPPAAAAPSSVDALLEKYK